MARSLNKVTLIGNLGQDPEIVTFANGDRIANLSLATSETYKDRTTGEVKEITDWHRIVIQNKALVGLADHYFKSGAKLYIEGRLRNRKYVDKAGITKYATEIVLRGYDCKLLMLDKADKSTGFDEAAAELVDDLTDGAPEA